MVLLLVWVPAHAPPASAAPILGVESEAVVGPWAKRLRGLRIQETRISAHRVEVRMASGCVLVLHHPESSGCADAASVGNALACWTGPSCPSTKVRARALKSAGSLELPWKHRAAEPSADPIIYAATQGPRDALVRARVFAKERLDVLDLQGARAHLLPLLEMTRLRPVDLLSVLPALAHLGEGARALAVTKTSPWSSLDPGTLSLTRMILLHGPSLALDTAPPLITGRNACSIVGLGSSLLMTGHDLEAARLMEMVRAADPKCFRAYATEIQAWSRIRRPEKVLATFAQARKRYGDDSRLAPLQEMAWYASGDVQALVAKLEQDVKRGDRSPGLFKKLLALYVQEELRSTKMKLYLAQVERDPEDAVSAFFAGVLLHYEKEYARSNHLLARAELQLAAEPRLHIYRAMNAFNLGDRMTAEQSIAYAATLETQDPDVFYCQGEILRDTDRPAALRALNVYWHQTSTSSDALSSKQQRVRGMMQAIERCMAEDTPAPCPGPWEHTFGSAR